MKNCFLLLLIAILPNTILSQVSTAPTIPTVTNEIIVTFDATGTGLADYTGDVYAHTGITVNGEKWQNVLAGWSENIDKAKLTRDSKNSNLYTYKITPNLHTFYAVETTSTITEVSFVFRSSDGSLKNGADIFIPIYAPGLNIAITNPETNSVFDLNQTITITAEATLAADLEIFIDNISLKTETNATVINSIYTFNMTGNHIIKAIANDGSETKTTEHTVYVKTATQSQTIPSGLKNGVNINNDNSVTFVLLAPHKNDVFLIGDFNNWKLDSNYQMKKDGEQFWITLPSLNINTEYAYQYVIDYNIRVADPYSEKILDPNNDQYITDLTYPNLKKYPTDLTEGNASSFIINETPYTWSITNFDKPNQEELVIYEMLIRDFTKLGSYNEALTHLDYLQNLGVNAIELMPVNEFEGNDSWGYNPSFYMALDKAYGTKNDFKKFVDECHKRGIAVLTDVVFNHSFNQSPLLQMYWNSSTNKPASDNPWYNVNHNLVDNTDAHWGSDFNHTSQYTKTFFKNVLSYWMNEYKIDGFRFDFTKGFSNTIYSGSGNWASTYDSQRISILKEYSDHVWQNNPTDKPYVIFEHLSDNSEETELANYGILLWGNLNHSYNENTMGYGDNIDWISYKKRGWNSPNVVGYMESHDEERIMYKNLEYGKVTDTYSVKDLNTALYRQATAGIFLLTIPGPKMIWQFGELGYEISINENGRTGKKPIHWDYLENPNRKHIYDTWSIINQLKKKYPVFNTTDFSLNVGDLTKSILLKNTDMDVVIVGNFDVSSKGINAIFSKTGIWYEFFTGEEKQINSTSENISLSAGEYRLYTTKKISDPRGGTANDDSDNDGVNDSIDLCPNTPTGNEVNENGCTIFSLKGDNFSIKTYGETCDNKNNGSIDISSTEKINFTAKINNEEYPFSDNLSITDLPPNTYTLCITTSADATYEQCFEIFIPEASSLSAKSNSKNTHNGVQTDIIIEEGTAPYSISINDEVREITFAKKISLQTQIGDVIKINSSKTCEGTILEKVFMNGSVSALPNPTTGKATIYVNDTSEKIQLLVYNPNGSIVINKYLSIKNNTIELDLKNQSKGIYFIKIIGNGSYTSKIIKN
ncbi:alpha-amylase family glycosyl hydrolase [Bacteroidota bacterium]